MRFCELLPGLGPQREIVEDLRRIRRGKSCKAGEPVWRSPGTPDQGHRLCDSYSVIRHHHCGNVSACSLALTPLAELETVVGIASPLESLRLVDLPLL